MSPHFIVMSITMKMLNPEIQILKRNEQILLVYDKIQLSIDDHLRLTYKLLFQMCVIATNYLQRPKNLYWI